MQKGSCQCGKVVFGFEADLLPVYYCYCRTCRKLSGSAFSLVSRVNKAAFKIIKGENHLQSYQSSLGKYRYNCRTCCSPIYVDTDLQPEFVRLRLGLLDEEPNVVFKGHIWLSHKPAYIKIRDVLPQYEQWPDG